MKVIVGLLFSILSLMSNTYAMEEHPYEKTNDEYILFVGNPGVGKSTIINGILCRHEVKAGISVGKGLTQHCQVVTEGKKNYIDTPGLSDIDMKEQAALEIESALKKNGRYRIFFIVTVEGGRVRKDDVATIQTVLDAIDSNHIEYNIIVNKLKKGEKQALGSMSNQIRALAGINSGKYKTTSIIWNDYYNNLEDETVAGSAADLMTMPDMLLNFIHTNSQSMYIHPSKVRPLNIDDLETLKNEFGKKIADLNKKIDKDKDFIDQLTHEVECVKELNQMQKEDYEKQLKDEMSKPKVIHNHNCNIL